MRTCILAVLISALLPIATGASEKDLVGTWRRSVREGDSAPWQPNGLFQVGLSEGKLTMKVLKYTIVRDSHLWRGISGVRLAGDAWSFKADWGTAGTGEYLLRRTGPDVFEGAIVIKGKKKGQARFDKLLDEDDLHRELRAAAAALKTQIARSDNLLKMLIKDLKDAQTRAEANPTSFNITAVNLIQGQVNAEEFRVAEMTSNLRQVETHLAGLK